MNTFVNSIAHQEARTENGMKARQSTANACVDLFYNIGASRGKNIIPAFVAAYVENQEIALRIAQWARDARGGAGERQVFKDILGYLADNDPHVAEKLLRKVPEIGRWDDLLTVVGKSPMLETKVFGMFESAFMEENGLAAKWTPRKGAIAQKLRAYLGWTPKRYRKTIVGLTKVVEQQMCANDWDNIIFDHIPSVAAARYQKAFGRHTAKYAEYVNRLQTGEAKINASAVYPYDVIKSVYSGNKAAALAQWEALPNYIGDASILPMVDVSGSMGTPAGGYGSNSGVSCLDVALSLGLYLADKNSGEFKDVFLTFSHQPQLMKLKGNLLQKLEQMRTSQWHMNTNLHAAFEKVLQLATSRNVAQEDMPQTILILSDMQFDVCVQYDDSAIEMIARKYETHGYKMPKIVFWNLNASYGNAPVRANHEGVALVSGFSPSIMKSILIGEDFTPEAIMLKTVMVDRYDL